MIGLQMIGLDWKSQMIGWEPNDRIAACAVFVLYLFTVADAVAGSLLDNTYTVHIVIL